MVPANSARHAVSQDRLRVVGVIGSGLGRQRKSPGRYAGGGERGPVTPADLMQRPPAAGRSRSSTRSMPVPMMTGTRRRHRWRSLS